MNKPISSDFNLDKYHINDKYSFIFNILENLPNMVFVKDAENLEFVYFNAAGENLLGYKREDLLGKSDRDFFPKDEADFFIAKDREVLAGKEVHLIPVEKIQTKDGNRILRTQKVPLLDDNNKPVFLLGISADITEQYLTSEKLEKTKLKLEKLNAELESKIAIRTHHLTQKTQDLEHFTHLAAHDLKEPLRRIQNLVDFLHLDLNPDEVKKNQKTLNMLKKATNKARMLIDDFGILSQVSQNSNTREELDLKATILELIESNYSSETSKKIDFSFEGEFPKTIKAYANLLTQIYSNLINNAINYSSGDRVSIIFTCSYDSETDLYVFGVKNSGSEIASQDLENVFKIFKRLSNKNDASGSGIGLSICKKIIDHHNGSIWAESSDQFVHFKFTLFERGSQ